MSRASEDPFTLKLLLRLSLVYEWFSSEFVNVLRLDIAVATKVEAKER